MEDVISILMIAFRCQLTQLVATRVGTWQGGMIRPGPDFNLERASSWARRES